MSTSRIAAYVVSAAMMIVDPNKEIAKGYSKGIMPANYATTMTKAELDALTKYIYESVQGKG